MEDPMEIFQPEVRIRRWKMLEVIGKNREDPL